MKEQPSSASQREFDEDFKQSALKMIEKVQSVRSVAQGSSVSENLLHKWKQARHANCIRRHSALGYLSPEEYGRKFIEERDRKLGEVLDKKKAKGGCQTDCVNGNNQLNLLRERTADADYTRTLRRTAQRL